MPKAKEIKELELKYKKILMIRGAISLANRLILLFCVFLLLLLSQVGVFKKNSLENASKILGMFALFFCLIALALSIAEHTYIKKVKREVESANEKQEKQTSKLIRAQNIVPYLAITGGIISVFGELMAIINQYTNFGFNTWHGNLPINVSGMIDITAGLIGLVVLSIIVSVQVHKYSEAKKKYEKNNINSESLTSIRHDTILITVALVPSVMAVIGRTISSLESTQKLSIGKNGDTIFPLGMIVRISALVISIVLAITVIKIMYRGYNKQLSQLQKNDFNNIDKDDFDSKLIEIYDKNIDDDKMDDSVEINLKNTTTKDSCNKEVKVSPKDDNNKNVFDPLDIIVDSKKPRRATIKPENFSKNPNNEKKEQDSEIPSKGINKPKMI